MERRGQDVKNGKGKRGDGRKGGKERGRKGKGYNLLISKTD